jgi:hypothetical protein
MHSEWIFEGEEGGTIGIVVNREELTLSIYSGPDCDGQTRQTHYEFEPMVSPGEPWTDSRGFLYEPVEGLTYRTGPWVWSATRVHAEDPDSLLMDRLYEELGFHLAHFTLKSQSDLVGVDVTPW